MIKEMKQNFTNIDYIRKNFPDKYKILLNRIRCKYTFEEQIILKIEHEYNESILNMLDKRILLLNQNRNRMSEAEYQLETYKIYMMNRKVHNDEMNPLKVNIPKEYFYSQSIPLVIKDYFEKNINLSSLNLLEIYNVINIIYERSDIPINSNINVLIRYNIVNKDVDKNILSNNIKQILIMVIVLHYKV